MVVQFSILKALMVWLTTAASFVGSLPQYRCLCANSSKQNHLLMFSCSTTCCCGTRGLAEPAQNTTAKLPIRKCCQKAAIKNQQTGKLSEKQVSGRSCKKELVAADCGISSEKTTENRISCATNVWSLPLKVSAGEMLSDEISSNYWSSPPGLSIPPVDRVIAFRHLVI